MTRTASRAGIAIRGVLIALGIAAVFVAAGQVAASQAPGTPSSVSTSRADGTLTASWPAVTNATSYHVTYSSTGGSSWQLAALDHPAGGTSDVSITISVTNSETYIVGVRAKNESGGSGWRNSASSGPYTPPPTATPTAVPTNTPAPISPPGTVPSVSTMRADGTLTATWDHAAGATSYHITYTSNGGSSWELAALNHPRAGTSAGTITIDVDNGETYIVGVRAKNSAGWGSWRNSPLAPTYKPPAGISPPPPPTSMTITRSDGSMTVTWPAVSEADSYHVASSSNLGESWFRQAAFYTETSITFSVNNTLPYMVSVLSINDSGDSEWLDSAPVRPYVAPARPTGLAAAAGDESVTLSWNAAPNVSIEPITRYEYAVNHNDTSTGNLSGWGEWTSISGSDSGTTSHTVTGLTNGAEYRFKLRAVNAVGTSRPAPAASPWHVSATPRIDPPDPPGGVQATENNGSVTITWTNPNDDSINGYQYQQKQQGGAWGAQTQIGGSGAGTTSHTTGQLPGGTTYQFNIQALNAGGASRGTQVSVHVPARLAGPENLAIASRGTGGR